MNKLEELIKEFCPNGGEYKKLGELGKFYGGLSGKSKNDFTNGNEKFITYKNVYANPSLNLDVEDRVKINPGERQNTLQYGDIIFTGSSETPDECGFSSVITTQTSEKLYLNSFCFFFRLDNQSILLPDFAKHLFRAESIRYQIGKTASGVTRYNVSKDKMKQVQIPLPALPVQREIVRILDSFTLYSAELTAELTARRKQYEFYRDKLLNFPQLNKLSLAQCCLFQNGFAFKSDLFRQTGLPILRITNIVDGQLTRSGYVYFDLKDYKEDLSQYIVRKNDIVIAMSGATTGKIGWNYSDNNYYLNQRVGKFLPKENILNRRYLYFWLQSKQDEILQSALGSGAQPNLSSKTMMNFEIPVPPMEVQERIVKVLDNFDAICSDLGIGLPAEIEKRQKQYEYYRDKLLTFEEKNNNGEK